MTEKLLIDTVDGTWTQDDVDMVNWLIDELAKEGVDAKLSTEQRKKMSSSTFCGPERSFPVNDCAHYTAAKRLLGRYKGAGDKSRILACIERRGKALGCTGSKDSTNDTQNGDLKNMNELEQKIKDLELQISNFTKDMDTLKKEKEALTSKVTTLETEVKDKTTEISQLSDKIVQFKTENHKVLVNTVYDLRKELGKTDVKDLKDEEVKTYKENLAKRTEDSLKDSILDLNAEKVKVNKPKETTEKVEKKSVDSKDESNTEVTDKKKIDDGTETQMKDLRDLIELNKKK